MPRKLIIRAALSLGLLLVISTPLAEAGGRRFPVGRTSAAVAQRLQSPGYYVPFFNPYYATDPLYYGTSAYFYGVNPQSTYRAYSYDPGFESPGFYTPQPGFVTDLFP